MLAHRLGPEGTVQGESTITRLGDDHFYVLSGAAWELRDLDAFAGEIREGETVAVANVTDDYGVLVVAGPCARDTLCSLTDADLTTDDFRWLTGREVTLAGIRLRALRVNYVGSLGWELHAPMDRLPELYDAIWAAGEPHGIADFGTYAVNSLCLEKAYKAIGAELTNEVTPVESDIMRFVRMDKDFDGKASVEAAAEKGPWTRLVYGALVASGSDIRGGEPVRAGDEIVGVTTSGGFGHWVEQSLFFAYVDPKFAEAGAQLEAKVLGEWRSITILSEPAYDPQNHVLRS